MIVKIKSHLRVDQNKPQRETIEVYSRFYSCKRTRIKKYIREQEELGKMTDNVKEPDNPFKG